MINLFAFVYTGDRTHADMSRAFYVAVAAAVAVLHFCGIWNTEYSTRVARDDE